MVTGCLRSEGRVDALVSELNLVRSQQRVSMARHRMARAQGARFVTRWKAQLMPPSVTSCSAARAPRSGSCPLPGKPCVTAEDLARSFH